MTDWRQIQARIRKAKAGADPPAHLAALYERTRDAMVAYELGQCHEKAGKIEEAVRWYTTAAERFRRAQWKAKAEEALARLGAPLPVAARAETSQSSAGAAAPSASEESWASAAAEPSQATLDEAPAERGSLAFEPATSVAEQGSSAAPAGEVGPKRRRRRGRRGGRGRRRAGSAQAQAVPEVRSAPSPISHPALPRHEERSPGSRRPAGTGRDEETVRHPPESPSIAEPVIGPAAWQARGRAGEPALASRLAHLESQLRRLLASQLYSTEEAGQAPAGPGVFILSDSDQTTYYYIESCQTLRIGIGNVLRSERGPRRGGDTLRARFADHLGINESRVSKYLKDHCSVRWLQLDEGASLLAHFAIAVLRPVLND